MPTLSTGLVIAGAYADKVRRTLFAQLKDKIKAGEIASKEVARAAGELNRFVYYVLVDKLKADKGDVVRIRANYEVKEGRIEWDYNSVSIELWRREPDEKIEPIIKESLAVLEEIIKWPPSYELEYIVETGIGDRIYLMKIRERNAGAIIATKTDGEIVVRGAVVYPSPLIIGPMKMDLGGRDIDTALKEDLPKLVTEAKHVEANEAIKVIEVLQTMISTIKGEKITIVEKVEGKEE